jgi:hypothetical protein
MAVQGAFIAPGITHFWAAHTRPCAHPSSTVQAPFAAARGAHTPQSPLAFSQCVLMHCKLDPQRSPFSRLPGLIWQDAGKTCATRSSQVAFAASRAQVTVLVVSGCCPSLKSRVHPSVTRDLWTCHRRGFSAYGAQPLSRPHNVVANWPHASATVGGGASTLPSCCWATLPQAARPAVPTAETNNIEAKVDLIEVPRASMDTSTVSA